nr:glycosyl transferase [Acidobacteriota bacterium]
EDLAAAVDVVVTKPGYGIVSECIANHTAMLYTSRGDFVEYDVMVREMPNVLRCRFLEQDWLRAGRWLEALDELLDSPPAPRRPDTNGAEIAAAEILRRVRD